MPTIREYSSPSDNIGDKQGHDLLAVKQNQPEPRAAIAESIGDLTPFGRPARKHRTRPDDATTAETIGKAHGRLEFRRAEISAEVMAHLGRPDAAQVMRIERTREIKGKTSVEVTDIVTSVPKGRSVARTTARSGACALGLREQAVLTTRCLDERGSLPRPCWRAT